MFWSDGTAGGLAGHRAPEGTAFVIRANNKKAIRAVAKLLAAIMVLPHLLLVGSSSVVMAQTEAATTNVAVLDFANVSKYGDSVISRLATDAVVVELTKSEKFTVETLQRTREAMADLDLRYPLTTAGMLRLAEELAVNAMVVGKVREVSITDKPRQARVELEVQMLDGATGEPMNGAIVRGASPLFVDDPAAIKGKRVLVIEDGPTLTHGGMAYGAGVVAARRFGAAELVDPRPYAVGSIVETYRKYPTTGSVLPAMGYGEEQTAELEQTIRNTPCDLVIVATPIDLRRVLKINRPTQRVRYELQEIGQPTLQEVLSKAIS